MANRKISVVENHSERVGVRLTPSEHARLTEQADINGVTLSAWVRGKVVGSTLRSRVDSKAISELRRQGGLLKHLVLESTRVDRKQVAELLRTIEKTILDIASGKQP